MYLQELNSTRFGEEIQRLNTVILPIGSTEAHGPHCALGTDNLIPAELAKRIDAVLGDKVMIAPPIPYGHTWGLAPFPGTLNIESDVFAAYVTAVGSELLRQGFKYLVLLNGHGGNIPSLAGVTEKLADQGAKCLTLNWWVDYKAKISQVAPGTGHAGEDETSLVMSIDQRFADLALAADHVINMPANVKFKGSFTWSYPQAQSGEGSKATVEKGLEIFNILTDAIISDIQVLWNY